MKIEAGKHYLVNGSGDLAMERGKAEFIGAIVYAERITKSGMVECLTHTGKKILFAPKNLSVAMHENS